jgi:hypothetical protein
MSEADESNDDVLDFHQPAGQRVFALAIPVVSTAFVIYCAATGRSISLVGVSISGATARAFAGVVAAFGSAFLVYALRKILQGKPEVRFDRDGLVATHFPLQRRVRWAEIATVSEPSTVPLMFGSKITSIVIATHDGKRLRLMPNYREASVPEFYEALVERWQSSK